MKMARQFPLNALRVFEAVARHMSFTRAGDELGMTQTAVSYQIKLLEENIGEPLFLRRPRQITLTESGERLAPRLGEAFAIMHEALTRLREKTQTTLTIHSTPTFAQQWLSRYIGGFQLLHPQIAVRLETSPALIDFARESADVAIRWGRGDWPGLKTERIMHLDFTPMLSPQLAETIGGIGEPSDLLKLPIISAGDKLWGMWFEAAGVPDPMLEKYPRNEFGTQLIDAAIAAAGQGVAILNPAHFAEEIAAGKLYQPFDLMLNDGRDYWLAYPESRRNLPKIKAFHAWIMETLGR
ncbi:MAG TPA: LysR substrate-binding domain-containing protein [Rhizobium sp.]|nr:LysR substrate-binding domain-containing protein [Rhizobium sp.]